MIRIGLSREQAVILRAVAMTGWRSIVDDSLALEAQINGLSGWEFSNLLLVRIGDLKADLDSNRAILEAFEPVADKLEEAVT